MSARATGGGRQEYLGVKRQADRAAAASRERKKRSLTSGQHFVAAARRLSHVNSFQKATQNK